MAILILNAIKTNPKITASEVAAEATSSERTIQRHMKSLCEDGIISRMGSDIDGMWMINE